jgi:uncharacterized protein YqjF (DUF2071 family)
MHRALAQAFECVSHGITFVAPVLLWLLHVLEAMVGRLTFMTHGKWENALFVHYEVDPDKLQRCLPPGLELDMMDGKAYVGIVLLTESDIRPFNGMLPISISHHAANVRIYVKPTSTIRGANSTPGIFFLSLDCTSVLATVGARGVFGLPYTLAIMGRDQISTTFDDKLRCCRFQTNRCSSPAAAAAIFTYEPMGVVQPDRISNWFLERYCLYQNVPDNLWGPRSLLRGRVSHAAWRLSPVCLDQFDETLLDSVLHAGLCCTRVPSFIHFANTENVTFSLFESI